MFFPLNQNQKKGYMNQRLSRIIGGMNSSIIFLMIFVKPLVNVVFVYSESKIYLGR